MIRIGYFVPQFPGQTHAFFWREIAELRRLGIEVDLLSTRKPPAQIVSHAWSSEAMGRTTYLQPLRGRALARALGVILRAGPIGWWRMTRTALSARASWGFRVRMLLLTLASARLAVRARDAGWTHMHVHSCADAAVVALQAHMLVGLTYSLTLHGPLHDYGPAQELKWRHAAGGIVITERLRREAQEQLGASLPKTLLVAPMGVDTSQFTLRQSARHGSGGDGVRIFSCGRLNPCKGHDDVIRAVALLAAQGVSARLRIAGEDSLPEKPYRAALARLAAELSVGERVELLGAISESQVRGELENADVFALASHEEPLGVAIMEAMAVGAPVVATRAGGVPELIEDGRDGILVAPQQPQALASAVLRVTKSAALGARLAANARKRVEECFSSRASAEAVAEIVRSAVA